MKSIIALLPEGFNLVIGESFTGSNNEKIFVFEHVKSKKKLYAKLCSPMDIQQGFIWEILTPEALKELNVEESVNSEYYSGTGKMIEESVAEDEEAERIRKETEKFMEEQKKKNSQVVINLIGGKKDGDGEILSDVQAERDDLKNKLSIIARRRFDAKKKSLKAPDSIKTPEELRDWEAIKGDLDPTRKNSSGTLSLAGQTDFGSGTAFENQAEMLAELQRRAHSGKTMEIREESKKILTFLWEKYLRGKKGKARHEAFEEMQDEGEGLIKKFQREYRKRMGVK